MILSLPFALKDFFFFFTFIRGLKYYTNFISDILGEVKFKIDENLFWLTLFKIRNKIVL